MMATIKDKELCQIILIASKKIKIALPKEGLQPKH